jgi:hypothetical protein
MGPPAVVCLRPATGRYGTEFSNPVVSIDARTEFQLQLGVYSPLVVIGGVFSHRKTNFTTATTTYGGPCTIRSPSLFPWFTARTIAPPTPDPHVSVILFKRLRGPRMNEVGSSSSFEPSLARALFSLGVVARKVAAAVGAGVRRLRAGGPSTMPAAGAAKANIMTRTGRICLSSRAFS